MLYMMVHVVVWLMKFGGDYTNRRCSFWRLFQESCEIKNGKPLSKPTRKYMEWDLPMVISHVPYTVFGNKATDGT